MVDIQTLTDRLCDQLFVELEASGRHVHLSSAHALALFGHGLTEKKPLSQPGQYACNERVTLVGPKSTMENVAVLGPCRTDSQVEISRTDAVKLGISAPLRLSGDVANTSGITLTGTLGSVQLTSGVMVAQRHLHMTPQDAKRHKINNGDVVSIKAITERPIIFQQVAVRVSDQFQTRVHLDFDEANACDYHKGDLGLIVYE